MPRLIWTAVALRDVARLRAFLVTKNPDAARRAVARIRQAVRLLEDHPQAGMPVEEMDTAFRAWPIAFGASGYMALYRVTDTAIVILAIRHGREVGY